MDREDSCLKRYFRLPVSEISYVRFIVESYEGLAQVSSVPRRGEIEWIIPAALAEQAQGLIEALAREISLVPIPRPPDWPL